MYHIWKIISGNVLESYLESQVQLFGQSIQHVFRTFQIGKNSRAGWGHLIYLLVIVLFVKRQKSVKQ